MRPPPLNCDTCTGELAIDSVSLHSAAWCCLDVTELWLPAWRRGDDRRIPGAPGVRPYPRRRDVTERELPMVLTGWWDRLGQPHDDEWEGLEANLDFLRLNVIDPTNVGDGTRTAVLTMPSGAVRSGPVHVLELTVGRRVRANWAAVLTISIPGGVLA